jgi:hypothetical protein
MPPLFDKPKRHLLKDAKVIEVSAVDRPAQPGAMILLRKDGASELNEIVLVKSFQRMPERMAYGIAAVSTVNGEPYFDLQGDHIPTDELVKMAHGFITDYRVGGALHLRDPESGEPLVAGHVVESVVLSSDLQKALGIDLGRECWLIGLKVEDEHVLKMIEAGHLAGFSIGGTGRRVEVSKMSKQNIDVVEVIKRVRADPPIERERFESYFDRVFKSEQLPLECRLIVRDMFHSVKKQALDTKHDDRRRDATFAKRAANTLETLAKNLSAETGVSYAQAFTAVCKQNPDLYRQAAKAGAFEHDDRVSKGAVKGPGFNEPGDFPRNHADGGDEEYPGEDQAEAAFAESNDFYSPEDVSAEAAEHPQPDATLDSNVSYANAGFATGIRQLRSTTDKLMVESAAAGKRLSRPAAIAKAYKIHSDLYAKMRRAGWDGSIDD